jgi:hypothetical protein
VKCYQLLIHNNQFIETLYQFFSSWVYNTCYVVSQDFAFTFYSFSFLILFESSDISCCHAAAPRRAVRCQHSTDTADTMPTMASVCGCTYPSPFPATGDKNPPEMYTPTGEIEGRDGARGRGREDRERGKSGEARRGEKETKGRDAILSRVSHIQAEELLSCAVSLPFSACELYVLLQVKFHYPQNDLFSPAPLKLSLADKTLLRRWSKLQFLFISVLRAAQRSTMSLRAFQTRLKRVKQ